ncbi:MAG: hypothetical protein M3N07_04520 [Pseudomonadota bacterium]|nr:hypothetical protein [Pseudomonadota bacterium]
MKSVIFAAALVIGGAAMAQTPPGDGITQQGTNPEGQPCTPAGFNQGISVYPPCGPGNVHPAAANPQNPPPCSRTVTDHCIQTYERGVSRRR